MGATQSRDDVAAAPRRRGMPATPASREAAEQRFTVPIGDEGVATTFRRRGRRRYAQATEDEFSPE